MRMTNRIRSRILSGVIFCLASVPCAAQETVQPTAVYLAVLIPQGKPAQVHTTQGIYVQEVVHGGPARNGGFRPNDIIVAFGGTSYTDGVVFLSALKNSIPRRPVAVTILRGDQKLALSLSPNESAPGQPFEVSLSTAEATRLVAKALADANGGRLTNAEELSVALEIYPTWPAEQFDLALVLRELNRFSEAIQHMQNYLELVPNAPDAQAAKDKMIIWKDKIAPPQ